MLKRQTEYYISNNSVIVTLFNRNFCIDYEAQNETQNFKLDILNRRENFRFNQRNKMDYKK